MPGYAGDNPNAVCGLEAWREMPTSMLMLTSLLEADRRTPSEVWGRADSWSALESPIEVAGLASASRVRRPAICVGSYQRWCLRIGPALLHSDQASVHCAGLEEYHVGGVSVLL